MKNFNKDPIRIAQFVFVLLSMFGSSIFYVSNLSNRIDRNKEEVKENSERIKYVEQAIDRIKRDILIYVKGSENV